MHGGGGAQEAMPSHRRCVPHPLCARRSSPAAGWPLLAQSRSGAGRTDLPGMHTPPRSPSASKIGQSYIIVFLKPCTLVPNRAESASILAAPQAPFVFCWVAAASRVGRDVLSLQLTKRRFPSNI